MSEIEEIKQKIRERGSYTIGFETDLLSSLETSEKKVEFWRKQYDLLESQASQWEEELEKKKEENARLNRVYNLELERVNRAENQHFRATLKWQKEKERADKAEHDHEVALALRDAMRERIKELEEAVFQSTLPCGERRLHPLVRRRFIMDLPPISKEYLTHVDATSDRDYPLRILRAYRANCDCFWKAEPSNIVYDVMNEHQRQRAKLLDEAIEILEKYFSV